MPKKKETKAEKEARLTPSFVEFWTAYPRKENKKPSFLKWCAINPNDELVRKIITSVEKYKLTRQWQDKQFIPMPQTFLNQERWENEVPPPAKKAVELDARGADKLVNERAVTIKIPTA